MVDISLIGTALTSIKTAIDTVTYLKDSSISLKEAEAQHKLSDIIKSLADANVEIARIQNIVLEKDRRIKELEGALELKAKMKWCDPVYYQRLEGGGEEGPFCQRCYDKNGKAVRLQTHAVGFWSCSICDENFYSQDYNPNMQAKADTDFDLFA